MEESKAITGSDVMVFELDLTGGDDSGGGDGGQ